MTRPLLRGLVSIFLSSESRRLFHVVTTTHNLGSHRMDSWWSIDPFQEVHWDSNHWGGELWKECCNVCADWGARAHCRYVYTFSFFIFYFYRVVCIENKYIVLPPNSRFLGPGISRELEILNWSLTPPNSLFFSIFTGSLLCIKYRKSMNWEGFF